MTYQRVIPRDLFNEAKLLKCIGRLTCDLHDNKLKGLTWEHDSEDFKIDQTVDGDIYIANLRFFDDQGDAVEFFTQLNSKENWPLFMIYKEDTYYCYNKKGKWMPHFFEVKQ